MQTTLQAAHFALLEEKCLLFVGKLKDSFLLILYSIVVWRKKKCMTKKKSGSCWLDGLLLVAIHTPKVLLPLPFYDFSSPKEVR